MISRERVTAFRLQRLGLRQRAAQVGDGVGEVGLPDFPPGAALAALAPRLETPSPQVLEEAFERRALVRARAMRGAPVVVRTDDYEVFVAGVLPPDEAAMRTFIGPAAASVDAAGMRALEAVELVASETRRALSRRHLDRDTLHAELRARLPEGLLPYCRPCDSHHVHPSLLYAVALRARLVLYPQASGPYLLARADRWLAKSGRAGDQAKVDAPAELLRRYLRAYGPSTASDFATWAGVATGQARAAWSALETELCSVEVELGQGRPAKRWILAADRKALAAARPATRPVRLVWPGDPLLQLRDRATLVAEPALQKTIWKNLAPAGVLVAGTQVAGIARAKKRAKRLEIAIEAIGALDAKTRAAAEAEAERLAAVRDLTLTVRWH